MNTIVPYDGRQNTILDFSLHISTRLKNFPLFAANL